MSEKKYRIYELAKDYGVSSKEVMAVLESNQIEFKNHTSTVTEEAHQLLERKFRSPKVGSFPAQKSSVPTGKPPIQEKAIPKVPPVKAAEEKKETPQTTHQEPKKEAIPHSAPVSSHKPRKEGRSNFTPRNAQQAPFKPRVEGQSSNQFKPREQSARPQNNQGNRPAFSGNSPRPQQGDNRRPVGAPGASRPQQGDNRRPGGAPGAARPQQQGENRRPIGAAPRAPKFAPSNTGFTPSNNNTGRPSHFSSSKKKGKDSRWKEDDANAKRVSEKNNKHQFQKPTDKKAEKIKAERIEVGESISVKDFAEKAGLETNEVIKKLLLLGIMATINQEIDFDTAALIGADFDIAVDELPPEADPTEIIEVEDDPSALVQRPPVVTIMGHVDHGKTSLLDVIRATNVTAREAGGITQHIGAYQISVKGKKITFLDTPGHEAFTAMRARGAESTDIAVLVVAANDGVMPQTIEAINHAKSAKVPIIVAINKMDVPEANPDRVKQQLADHGLVSEDWGGDTIMVPVSARQKSGIDDLLENILLVAEVEDLKANPHRPAHGVVIEAQLDKGRGPVATILVQTGTLRIGDSLVVGISSGKVRALINDKGENVKKAEPSVPVEVLGLSDVPEAGDIAIVADEKVIRSVVTKRQAKKRTEEMQHNQKVSLEDIFQQIQDGQIKDLNIVIKGDVQGSIEALRQSLESLKNKEVRVNIIHSGVGAINESDVMLASASNAIIIGFNVRPDANARKSAEAEKVDIHTYRVIYEAIQDVEKALDGMLAPEFKEVVYGHAEVRQVIGIPKGGVVAGSYVQDGKITNNSQIRVTRGGIVIHEGPIESLRRFKDDVKEVATGYECGISLERFRDIKEGDILEAFGMEEIKRN